MSDLLAKLREHERDFPELIHGPLCGEAADTIDELVAALQGAMVVIDTLPIPDGASKEFCAVIDNRRKAVLRAIARATEPPKP